MSLRLRIEALRKARPFILMAKHKQGRNAAIRKPWKFLGRMVAMHQVIFKIGVGGVIPISED
jgi:hypothetical protein